MALRYLETCHGFNNGQNGAFKARTQSNVYIVDTSFDPSTAGRFAGQGSLTRKIVTASKVYHYMRVDTSFAKTDTIHVAVDSKQVQTSPGYKSLVFAINDTAVTAGSYASDNVSSAETFVYLVYDFDTSTFQLRNGATTLASSAVYSNYGTVYHRIEASVNISTGTVRVYINDFLEISEVGLPIDTAGTTVESVSFFGSLATNMSMLAIWDDVGTTGFTGVVGDFKPVQLLPDADGSVVQSTPVGAANSFECVNDSFANGATDYASLFSNGDTDLYSYTPISEGGSVLTVVVQPSIFKNELGNATAKVVAKSGAAEAESAPNSQPFVQLFDSFGQRYLTATFDVNPDTGLPWTEAEINAAEFGVRAAVAAP